MTSIILGYISVMHNCTWCSSLKSWLFPLFFSFSLFFGQLLCFTVSKLRITDKVVYIFLDAGHHSVCVCVCARARVCVCVCVCTHVCVCVCLSHQKDMVLSTDQRSCCPIRQTEVDPSRGGKQEIQGGLLLTLFELRDAIRHEVEPLWLSRRYLLDNQVEKWKYKICTACFCKASWELIGRKLWRDRRVSETVPLRRLWWGKSERHFLFVSLPFCLLNGSLGGLRSVRVRSKSRPKKGLTYQTRGKVIVG